MLTNYFCENFLIGSSSNVKFPMTENIFGTVVTNPCTKTTLSSSAEAASVLYCLHRLSWPVVRFTLQPTGENSPKRHQHISLRKKILYVCVGCIYIKTRVIELPCASEYWQYIASFRHRACTRVTEGQTERLPRPRDSVAASRGKKWTWPSLVL